VASPRAQAIRRLITRNRLHGPRSEAERGRADFPLPALSFNAERPVPLPVARDYVHGERGNRTELARSGCRHKRKRQRIEQ
jgi:hypothetical protein